MTWRLLSTSGIALACAESFAALPFVAHGVTTRSEDAEGFNLSLSTAKDEATVRANRQRVCEALGFGVERLVVPSQVHGVEVRLVGEERGGTGASSPRPDPPECDALITNTPGLLLGITIADCLPVFLLDPTHRAVGLAHSGWRGTAGRIVPRTLAAMTEAFDTRPQDCLVAIGPGIGGDGYEVDATVHNAFDLPEADAPGVFSPTRPGHWTLDLTAAVLFQLRDGGVPPSQIELSPWRTNRDTRLFYSHRRVPGCPRMGAFLGLRAGTL